MLQQAHLQYLYFSFHNSLFMNFRGKDTLFSDNLQISTVLFHAQPQKPRGDVSFG